MAIPTLAEQLLAQQAQQKGVDPVAQESVFQQALDRADTAPNLEQARATAQANPIPEFQREAQTLDAAVINKEAKKAKDMLFLQREAARLSGVPFAESGQVILTDPISGQQKVADLPGTATYKKQYLQLQGSLEALRLINRIANDVEQSGTSGTDFIGSRAINVDANRSKLFSAIFQARGLGAPQGPDIELVEKGLPDSTGLLANLRGVLTGGAGGQKAGILQGYQTVAEEMQQSLTDTLLQNPVLIDAMNEHDVGQLHPDSDLFHILTKLKGI